MSALATSLADAFDNYIHIANIHDTVRFGYRDSNRDTSIVPLYLNNGEFYIKDKIDRDTLRSCDCASICYYCAQSIEDSPYKFEGILNDIYVRIMNILKTGDINKMSLDSIKIIALKSIETFLNGNDSLIKKRNSYTKTGNILYPCCKIHTLEISNIKLIVDTIINYEEVNNVNKNKNN
jgi:hypothetical protein